MKLFLLITCFFIASNSIAQTPKEVEADLLKSFKKISYWDEQRSVDTTARWSDSLDKANDVFGKKLKYYTCTYPFTIHYPFNSFASMGDVNIVTSADGLFRIYSWDTETGGTQRDFENILQFKSSKSVKSILALDSIDVSYSCYYVHLYTLKARAKTYYLGVYYGVFSSKDRELGIKIFSVENGKLNDNVKLIKTAEGMTNEISCDYDFFTTTKKIQEPDILFDPISKTLSFPLIMEPEKVTNRHITYKFTGRYFEKVKN